MATHRVQVITSDGVPVHFDCDSSQTLLEGAAAQELGLPFQCGKGGCGACYAVAEGSYELGEHSREALPPKLAERGGVLLCRTYPRGPLVIRAAFRSSAITQGAVPERKARIVELTRPAAQVVRLCLQLEPDESGSAVADFIPGQFIDIAVPGSDAWRSYSLANTTNWDGTLELWIRLQEGGLCSAYLRERAALGQHLTVRGPRGSFALDESSLHPRWFVAGGTGLSPLLSMLRHMAELGDTSDCRLYFGVNREPDLFALEELEALARALPTLKYEVCVWQPEASFRGFHGTPADAMKRDLQTLQQQSAMLPDVYVCGPPALVRLIESAARDAGIDDAHLHVERFLPA
ncbi:MAG TPA: 2Fe-2S iron-sulfur cluster binding domain-containing protein [Polyangiales bacterium]